MRIDFLSLNLAQPDGDGNCVYDAMTITGGGSQVPVICGENTGQHVYVDFENDNVIIINIATGNTVNIGRTWNLKISQIGCACPTKGKWYFVTNHYNCYKRFAAPSGCLMYYTDVSGTVQSFNYGTTANGELSSQLTTGTRQLVNQNYGICIAMEPGYCSIQWSQSQINSFTVSNDTEADADILGTPAASVGGFNCSYDFVIIPNPYIDTIPLNYDRFCGNGLPTVTCTFKRRFVFLLKLCNIFLAFTKPFVLYVINNEDEVDGIANRGFSLDYTQQRCSSLIV